MSGDAARSLHPRFPNLDPAQRSLEVFRRTPEGWLLVGDHDGADVVRAEPFAAVALDLSMLRVE